MKALNVMSWTDNFWKCITVYFCFQRR